LSAIANKALSLFTQNQCNSNANTFCLKTSRSH